MKQARPFPSFAAITIALVLMASWPDRLPAANKRPSFVIHARPADGPSTALPVQIIPRDKTGFLLIPIAFGSSTGPIGAKGLHEERLGTTGKAHQETPDLQTVFASGVLKSLLSATYSEPIGKNVKSRDLPGINPRELACEKRPSSNSAPWLFSMVVGATVPMVGAIAGAGVLFLATMASGRDPSAEASSRHQCASRQRYRKGPTS